VQALAESSRVKAAKEAESISERTPKRDFGASTGISFAFQLAEFPIHRVEWVCGHRFIAWSSFANDSEGGRAQSALFLVDVKAHTVTQLMNRLNVMEITNVILSPRRDYFCVISDRVLATFFSLVNNQPPRCLATLAFRAPVTVAFRPNIDMAVVFEGCEMRTVVTLATRPRMTRAVAYPTPKGEMPMGAFVNDTIVTVVTASGAIVQANVKAQPFTVVDTKQLKAGFAALSVSFLGSLMIDDRGGGLFVSASGEWLSLPCAVKHAVLCTQISFLAKVRGGRHVLRALQFVGQFAPLQTLIASKCPAFQDQADRNAAIASAARAQPTCLNWGMPLAMVVLQAREAPQWAYEQTILLRHLCRTDPKLTERVARYSYLVHDYELPRQLFLSTNTEDSVDFLTNILKAVTIKSGGSEGLKRAASLLLVRGLVDEATDLLLMTGNWQAAANNLITLGMLSKAALVLRVQEQSSERTELMLKLAVRMLAMDMIAYGMILLSEIADFDQIAGRFGDAGETGQSAFLQRLAWE
jgi:hypothetical protein